MTATASIQKATNVRWLIVAMLTGFTLLGHFNRVSISVAGTEQFTGPGKLSNEQMGLIYSTFLLVYTFAMMPGGWVIDRVGPRLAMTGMGMGMGFCVILTGVLGLTGWPIVSLWTPLLFIRGFAGLLSSPLHPGAARSVSLWLPIEYRATGNGLVTAGALIGIAITFPGFGWLMDQLNWPTAFIVSGAFMMSFTTLWYLLSTDDAARHPWVNEAEKRLVPYQEQSKKSNQISLDGFLKLFCHRNLILLTLSYSAVGYFQYLFFYWIGFYFEKQLELPVAESRRAAFLVTISMAVGMSVGGICSDFASRWIGRRWGYRMIALVSMGLCALFGWQGVKATDPTQVTILFSLALGLLGLSEGIFWTTAPLLEKQNPGMACAFLNTVGNAVSLLAPYLTPVIGARFGWTAAIAVACIICALGAVLWFWIDAGSESDQPVIAEGPSPIPVETM